MIGIAARAGLDAARLETELAAGTYKPVLEETTRTAKSNMISSAPTFVIDRYGTVTGAEPIENFRQIFNTMTRTAG